MVVFSNGFLESYSPTWTPTFIDLMNKRLLYSNLQDFISHFSKTGQIELKVLTYGKYFIAREIEDIFDQLTNLMSSAQNLKSNLTEVKELARKFANIADADNAVKVLLAMENIEGFPTPPFLNELEKILKSFFKYGRNIYH
jgi:hypothetical protein